MRFSTITSTLTASAAVVCGSYTLRDNFNASNFFNEFSFFSAADPTHGFVQYQNLEAANLTQLAGIKQGAVYLGVDHTTVNPVNGRNSTRVQSNKDWTTGLFIADIMHAPDTACGVWPAFWTVTSEKTKDLAWPNGGEIDIYEGVNDIIANTVTLHSGSDCNMTSKVTTSVPQGNKDGFNPILSSNCNAGVQPGTQGCGFGHAATGTYGTPFNAAGGGIYAMEWTITDIKVYYFPRKTIPADALTDSPDPASWPTPISWFHDDGGCDVPAHFTAHRLVMNINFCGDFAGNADVFAAGSCGKEAATCQEYVANNPKAFEGVYWQIQSIKVFQ
ncbi:mixed-linked glucanase [Calycina marina]|uniref:Mixed-linked glucanase n=1 Tax=Calycina marina TaxID=1763456 RepID=A0A9P8CBT3_9HELO|nr:mixed-linked glucanase [Calycina marina]